MRRRIAALLLVLGLALPATADEFADYIVTTGRLSDEDFYRLIACGAAPGEPCDLTFVRWAPDRAADLRVALAPPQRGYPVPLAGQLSAALDGAIDQINGVGAAITLRREDKPARADIVVRPVRFGDGDRLTGSGVDELDGAVMGAAFVYVWWNHRQEITEAVILMADDLPGDEVLPVMLEELTQSLGLMFDIRNGHYRTRSVFSEDSNAVRKLGLQDRMVLRRHYPATR